MKQIILLFFLVLCRLNGFALEKEELYWRKQFFHHPSERLRAAMELERIYHDRMPDSLWRIGKHLLVQGANQHNAAWLHYGKFLLSICYKNKGLTTEAFRYLHDCKMFYETEDDLDQLSRVFDLIAQILFNEKRYDEAIDQFVRSIETFDPSRSDTPLCAAQFNLAETYYAIGEYDLALKELEVIQRKAFEYGLENSQRKIYNLLSKIYLAQEDFVAAHDAIDEAFRLAKLSNDPYQLGSSYNQLGLICIGEGKLTEAKTALQKALSYRLQTGQAIWICESSYNLAELAYLQNHWDEAIRHYKQCLTTAADVNLFEEQLDALNSLSILYEERGMQNRALEYARQMNEVQEKRLTFETQNRNFWMEAGQKLMLYENNALNRQRERLLESEAIKGNSGSWWVFGLVAMVVAGIGLILFQRATPDH